MKKADQSEYALLLKGIARGAMTAARWESAAGEERVPMARAHAYQMIKQLGLPRGNAGGFVHEWNDRSCTPPLSEKRIERLLDEVDKTTESDAAFVDPTSPASRAMPIPFSKYAVSTHVDWIWEKYIARGYVTLLSGAPTMGKTTLFAWLFKYMQDARRDGEPCMALGEAVRPGKVLVITEENGTVWGCRGEEVGGLSDDIECLYVGEVFSSKPTMGEWYDFCTWVSALVSLKDYSIVLMDPWQSLNPAQDENDAMSNAEAISALRVVADEGAAVVISHHTPKNASSYIYAARGSGSITGLADFKLWLTVPPKSSPERTNKRVLRGNGRVGKTPGELVLVMDESGYRAITGDEAAHLSKEDGDGHRSPGAPVSVKGRKSGRAQRFAVITEVLGNFARPMIVSDILNAWPTGSEVGKKPASKTLYADLEAHPDVIAGSESATGFMQFSLNGGK